MTTKEQLKMATELMKYFRDICIDIQVQHPRLTIQASRSAAPCHQYSKELHYSSMDMRTVTIYDLLQLADRDVDAVRERATE